MMGDGPAALLAWLQAYDLTRFNVRAAPETAGLLEQKVASLRGIEKWWYEVLSAGELRTHALSGTDWTAGACSTARSALRDEYATWLRGERFEVNPLGDRLFGSKLHLMVPSLQTKRGGSGPLRIREYVLPALDVCREQFGTWIGGKLDWG